MRLIFNVIALLLATTALAAPVPSRPNDALIDSASTNEHTLAPHHHVHNSKHAKHVHHEKAELEERAFYDKEYNQLGRRGKFSGLAKLKIAVGKLSKGKEKAHVNLGTPTPSTAGASWHRVSPASDHHISPFTGHHVEKPLPPTPHSPHAGPSNAHAGPSNAHAGPSNAPAGPSRHEIIHSRPLPVPPRTPQRANSLPSSHHSEAPPPYSPRRGNSVDSTHSHH